MRRDLIMHLYLMRLNVVGMSRGSQKRGFENAPNHTTLFRTMVVLIIPF